MEPSQYAGEATPFITAAVALLVVFVVFRAKTRWAFFARWGLGAVIVLTLQVHIADTYLAQYEVRTPPPLEEALPAVSTLPTPMVVSLALAAVIWIGGGNWVIIRQRRKAGRSWAESFNPLRSPFRDMNARAWGQLALLAVLTFAVVGAGLELTEAQPSAQQASPALESQD